VLLSPSNPQSYDPQTYLIRGSLAVLAVIALFIVLGTVLPAGDACKRAWILRSFRTDFRRALLKRRLLRDGDALAFRDADRLGQLGALRPELPEDHAADLHKGLHWAVLTSAAWHVRLALDDPQVPSSAPDVLRTNATRSASRHYGFSCLGGYWDRSATTLVAATSTKV
jgi:hypothetical protein